MSLYTKRVSTLTVEGAEVVLRKSQTGSKAPKKKTTAPTAPTAPRRRHSAASMSGICGAADLRVRAGTQEPRRPE